VVKKGQKLILSTNLEINRRELESPPPPQKKNQSKTEWFTGRDVNWDLPNRNKYYLLDSKV